MKSEAYINGMYIQALKMLQDLHWVQFIKKSEIKGWIKALECVLEIEENERIS